MEKFWMIWNEGNNAPVVKHETLAKAKKEAERLATNNRGKKFVVLESLEFCEIKNPVIWQTTDDIPL